MNNMFSSFFQYFSGKEVKETGAKSTTQNKKFLKFNI